MSETYMKECSTSLDILDWLSWRTQTTVSVGNYEGGKKKPFYTVGGNVNLYNHCRKQYGSSSKN
jgi:hypothetical protein